MRRFLLSLLLATAASPAFAQSSTMAPVAPIAPQALADRIAAGDAPDLILDVRTREEYDAGHVPRARHIPHDELLAALDNLKAFQHAEIVLYCRSSRRSALAEATLREHEFTDLVQLEGSWQAWEAARLPVEVTSSEKPE
jgi:phage shock protein E